MNDFPFSRAFWLVCLANVLSAIIVIAILEAHHYAKHGHFGRRHSHGE